MIKQLTVPQVGDKVFSIPGKMGKIVEMNDKGYVIQWLHRFDSSVSFYSKEEVMEMIGWLKSPKVVK